MTDAIEESITTAKDDRPTILAFAVIIGFLAAIMHEALGHGLVAWLQGSHNLTVTNCYLNSELDTRAIDAAGTLVNLAVGLLAWFLLQQIQRSKKKIGFSLRYYLWLTMTVNLFDSTGYFFYSGVAGIGDWQAFIRNLHPYWLWRVGLVLLGSSLYFAAVMLSARWLTLLLRRMERATERIWSLTMLPYFTIGVAGSIAAAPNLLGWKLIVTAAAAATFGGLAGFFSVAPMVEGSLRKPPAGSSSVMPVVLTQADVIRRRPSIIALAILVFLINISIFGRGITWRNHHVFLTTASNQEK